MAYPGFVFVVIGISLVAMLYYMFSEGLEENEPNENTGPSNRNARAQSDDSYSDWDSHMSSNSLHRRQSSVKEDRKDSVCSICFYKMKENDTAQTKPCSHEFHMKCINEWRERGTPGTRELCPICRRLIRSVT